jgi:hypothetical protein
MMCLGQSGWLRPVRPPPGKMAQGGGWTVDVLPFEAAAEAVDGSEAEATTVMEATEVAADTRTAAGEAVATTIEVAPSPLHRDPECFFSLSYILESYFALKMCVFSLVLCQPVPIYRTVIL